MSKVEEYNLVLAGDAGVGKSALVTRLVQNKFVKEYDPTVEDAYRKEVVIDGQVCSMNILDTAGQDEHREIRDRSIRLGEGLLLVFDVNNAKSLKYILSLTEQIKVIKDDADVPLVLAGNKCDLPLTPGGAEMSEVLEWAKSNGIPLIETSAKSGAGVATTFQEIVREVRQYKQRNRGETSCCCRIM